MLVTCLQKKRVKQQPAPEQCPILAASALLLQGQAVPGMDFGGFSEEEVAQLTRELGIDLPPSPQRVSVPAGRPEQSQVNAASPTAMQQVQPLQPLQQEHELLPTSMQNERKSAPLVASGGQQMVQLARSVPGDHTCQPVVRLAEPLHGGQPLLQLVPATPSSDPMLQVVGTPPAGQAVLQLACAVGDTQPMVQLSLPAPAGGHLLQLVSSGQQLVQLNPAIGSAPAQTAKNASLVQHGTLHGLQPGAYLVIAS